MPMPMKKPERCRRLTLSVPPACQGVGLIELLAGRFTYLSRAEWLAEIAEGRIRVNGVAGEEGRMLKAGDRVAWLPADLPEPPVDEGFTVIRADADLLVVNKPGNLPCHPGGRYFRHTLWHLLRERYGDAPLSFVHRLDRETSGLVMVARTPAAARILARRMAARRVKKVYLVLVEGRFPPARLQAAGILASDPGSAVRKKRRFVLCDPAESPNGSGEAAVTRLEGVWTNSAISLVRAEPVTGRHHQIRATLLGLGYPVVGDKLYGVDEGLFLRFIADHLTGVDRRLLRLARQGLHAAAIAFDHPGSGKRLVLQASLPRDMAALIPDGHPEIDRIGGID